MTDEQQYRVYTVIILDDEGEFTSLGSSVVEYSELTPVGVSFDEAQKILAGNGEESKLLDRYESLVERLHAAAYDDPDMQTREWEKKLNAEWDSILEARGIGK